MVTVTTVTTVTAIATAGLAPVMGGCAVVALIVFLASRQLATAGASEGAARVARFLNIAIVPLVIAFTVTVVLKAVEVLA